MCDLRHHPIDVWAGLEQSVIDDGIGQWRSRLYACIRAAGKHFEQPVGGRPPQYAAPLSVCGRRSASEPTAPADGNLTVLSHAQYVPTLTAVAAWRVNAPVSKAAWWPWHLAFWPWKWCPCDVWRGLPLLVFQCLSVLDLDPMYATDIQCTSDRQTSDSIIA